MAKTRVPVVEVMVVMELFVVAVMEIAKVILPEPTQIVESFGVADSKSANFPKIPDV
ncbi:uncharacterized protein isoform X3 [Musca autumnalis]|uniref:uncharacterized protein isoform X3 n=1 Tax=Musca autumnalis TaxID=221902 RepID=UPI003CEB8D21